MQLPEPLGRGTTHVLVAQRLVMFLALSSAVLGRRLHSVPALQTDLKRGENSTSATWIAFSAAPCEQVVAGDEQRQPVRHGRVVANATHEHRVAAVAPNGFGTTVNTTPDAALSRSIAKLATTTERQESVLTAAGLRLAFGEHVRFLAMTICLVTMGACRPELPDGVFLCAADNECPDQFVCLVTNSVGHCARGVRSDYPRDLSDAGLDGGAGERTDTVMSGDRTRPDSGPPVSVSRRDGGTQAPARTDAGSGSPSGDAGMVSVQPAPDCLDDDGCNASSACARARCQDGRCVDDAVAQGMPLSAAEQVPGDCTQLICDGQGSVTKQPQADDLPPADGNTCAMRACSGGEPDRSPLPDGTTCNGTGQCQGGACSVCQGGADCTSPSHCTRHETRCVNGQPECTDTGTPLDGKACDVGKVCSAKQCVSCVLGAACGGNEPCRRSRITSCATGPVCMSEPTTGTSCGRDRVCAAGSCVYSCPTTRCGDAASCRSGRWDCSDPARAPVCNEAPVADGTACGDDSTCRAGGCARSALVNGDFAQGFRGWDLTGDAASFLIGVDANHYNRRFLTTWISGPQGNGDVAKGSVSQRFGVPADALALRFLVSGGHAFVRLRDESGNVLQEVTGGDSNDLRIPVSWDLTAHRGRNVTVSIDDDLDANGWSFVAVLGFDVIREVDAPLRNSQFSTAFDHWELTGDARYFSVWDDNNRLRVVGENMLEPLPAYGLRRSVSSYVHDTGAPRLNDAAMGSVSQRFVVPADAVALRFNVHGGRLGRVELREGNSQLYVISGADDNTVKLPVSWDLSGHRGKTLDLAIIDDRDDTGWTFISSTGFDVITSYNGP